MDNNKNFDRLNDTIGDSAKRQDEVFNRIQDIVKENPESAKQYLQHLTQTSKWELYSRIYGKFAYITLLIAFLVVALIVGIKKINGASEDKIVQGFIDLKPSFKLTKNNSEKFFVSYINSDTIAALGTLENFNIATKLVTSKNPKGWNIIKSDFNLGTVVFDIKQFEMDFDDEQYTMKTPHSFGINSSFWFNVEDVKTVIKKDSVKSIIYLVNYGEKNDNDSIFWLEKPLRIKKSDDARGLIEKGRSNMIILSHKKWHKTYFIEMSIGNNCKGDIYKLYGEGYSIGIE